MYWNFFLDFGPLNTGQLVRFCKKLNDKLRKFPAVCFYSNTVPAKRANAIFLICSWQMLYLDRTPEQAYAGFASHLNNTDYLTATEHSLPPISTSQGAPTIAELPPFHDASPCQCTYELTVFDCLKGLQKARQHNFFDIETFDVEEYEYFEQVEVRSFLRHILMAGGVTPKNIMPAVLYKYPNCVNLQVLLSLLSFRTSSRTEI